MLSGRLSRRVCPVCETAMPSSGARPWLQEARRVIRSQPLILPAMHSERLSIGALSEAHEPLYCELLTNPVTMRHIGPPFTMELAKGRFRSALASARREPPAGLLF